MFQKQYKTTTQGEYTIDTQKLSGIKRVRTIPV